MTEAAPGDQLFIRHDSREKGRGSDEVTPFSAKGVFFWQDCSGDDESWSQLMGEAAVGQANYFCAAPESLRQAFESCGLTAKERDFLFATVALRRGTAARGALAAGLSLDGCPPNDRPGTFLKVQWNSVVGHACSKIGGQLGWKKPSTGMWIDLLVTFERKAAYGLEDAYEEGKESFTWVVRPEWVEALR